jgi:hypothetical protein
MQFNFRIADENSHRLVRNSYVPEGNSNGGHLLECLVVELCARSSSF